METTGNKSAFVELICQLRDFGLSTAANAIRDLERDNVMVASNNHKLRTELAATQLQLKEAREIAEIIQRKADNSSKETCQLHMFDIATLATLILSRPADTSALDRLLAEKDARIKEAREALDSYDFKVFRRQQPKDVIDHICYNINRRWSEDLVSPWIVEAVISGLFYSAKSEADELFSRPADTTALDQYVEGKVKLAVAAAIELCKGATGQKARIDTFVNSAQIVHDVMGTDFRADELEGKS